MQMEIDTPLNLFLNGSNRIFWGYLIASVLIASVWYIRKDRSISLSRLKAYWLNADSKLDYRYFLVNWVFKKLLILPVLLSGQTVALWTLDNLNAVAEPLFLPWYYRDIVLCYTLSLFVIGDFSRYWLHRWMHTNRWLWKFHQVHHSPESLNPLTFYRLHPVEIILFALRHAIVAGVITGIFIFCFGARVDLYTVLGGNVFVVILFSFTGNLRHSHIRLGYGRWLEHLLVSPAQHQTHHHPESMQKNLGSVLALWDLLFGTLKLSQDAPLNQKFGLGVGKRQNFDSVTKIIINPFFDIYTIIRRKLK
ncbi:sterol desaturase family protein [Shewanella psychromarinicola]|uniref:Sterol desaturase family protein n=2 Tax=Shewanella psychromarinicola TaxID=2487742 RepID=A0A3N4EJ44_9GAMM|nr:sterol desaturase family protein [Shewanella psychromarinicola]RPA34260.1 sterol desaturase family protein [Shewanella psychromarinicola]